MNKKLLLIIIGSILAAILLFVTICTIVAHSQNDKTKPTDELSRWMGMIDDDTLLKNLVIPGAHDAGTKGLSYMAETQSRTTAELLACGTRYLDLRVNKKGDALKIYHGPFNGVGLDSVLSDVKAFLTENATETVILDFQHFGSNCQSDVAKAISEKLDGMILQKPAAGNNVAFAESVTLGQARGKCIVVWGDGYDEFANKLWLKRNDDLGERSDSAMKSYYESALNKKSSANYVANALPHYVELYKQSEGGMFVLQGQLTDGMLVFGPRFREATHNKNMNHYVENLKTNADLGVINVIMRDFVSPHKNSIALALNQTKGLVKPDCTTAFAKMISDNTK